MNDHGRFCNQLHQIIKTQECEMMQPASGPDWHPLPHPLGIVDAQQREGQMWPQHRKGMGQWVKAWTLVLGPNSDYTLENKTQTAPSMQNHRYGTIERIVRERNSLEGFRYIADPVDRLPLVSGFSHGSYKS